MASSAPSTPRRLVFHRDIIDDGFTTSGNVSANNRSRLNSKEIPRSYSGLYGAGAPPMPPDDSNNVIQSPPRVKSSVHHAHQSNLLPFELSRNRNTDWIAAGGPALLVTYVSVILVFLLTFLAFVTEPRAAWAMANVSHGLVSMVYLHWIKGNPADYMDGTQGEMNAMTCWEQIVSKPAVRVHNAASAHDRHRCTSRITSAIRKLRSRDVLCVVPTLLAHASCHVAGYRFEYVLINVGVWAMVMLPKLPFMNGVRILGINRTAGIDDGDYQEDEEDECVDDTEEDTSRESDDVVDHLDERKDELKKDR
ncbi:hypothetical protein ACHAW5_003057 [Stephanodiscus triporus]|uniref:ORM1-like protein 3 n=1 Tax=Stephanodiscus triporus TaxID=2934178 RepID=A0ABD3NMK3_9STRA